MKKYGPIGTSLLALSFGQVSAAVVERHCPTIVSAVERLACFDQAAGTAPRVAPAHRPISTPSLPVIFTLLQANERQRQGEHKGFVLSRHSSEWQATPAHLMISAPAIGAGDDPRYLAISCLSDISRLQLLLERPVERHALSVQLLMDGRALGAPRTWRVMDGGRVVDAGRGLPAVDLLKRMGRGSRLTVRSEESRLDGLVFDALGLASLIDEEREACHW